MASDTKLTVTKLIASTVLGVMTFPLLSNTQILAKTPSNQSQCTEVEIKKHVNQLDKANPSAYEALVACKNKAVPELIKALKSQNRQVRIMAITALGEIGSQHAILPLSDLLSKETRWDIRVSVIFALSNFGKQGVPTLIQALKDKDSYIRYQAANALSETAFDAKDAIYALNDAVKDENINVRSAAKRALVKIANDVTNRQNYINQDEEESRETSSTSWIKSAIINHMNRVTTSRIESTIHPLYPGRKVLYTQSKQPLICKSVMLRSIFKWKCG